jgi:raffinose/stachyose/melibiose transport system substrate-binding protein
MTSPISGKWMRTALTLGIALGFTAGASAQSAPVTISILTAQGSFSTVYKDMAAEIEKDTGYKIEFQVLPDDQYYAVSKAKVATNEVPDIIEYNTPSNNIELGAHENVIPLDNQPWVSRLVNPGLLKDPTDGRIYALPRNSGSFFGAAYYNKKVLDDLGVSTEQPKTYKEFLDRLEQIKVKGKGKVAPIFAANKDSWTTQIFMTLGWAVALYPNDQDTWRKLLTNKAKFTDFPEMKMILAQYKDLYAKGYINKGNLSATYDMSKEAVATGKAAMALQGEWFVSDINGKWPDVTMGSWVVPFNDHLLMGTGAFVRGWFVMKNGKHPQEALKLLEIWSRAKYWNLYFAKQPGFPAFKDVDGGKVDPSVTDLVSKYISTGRYTSQINDPMGVVSTIWPDLWKMYVEMVATDKKPEDVLTSWQAKYADYMKQLKQPGF